MTEYDGRDVAGGLVGRAARGLRSLCVNVRSAFEQTFTQPA